MELAGLGPPLQVLMAVFVFLCIFHLCSPLSSSPQPGLPAASHFQGSCALGCLGRAVAWCGRRGGPGVGPPSNAAPFSHQHSPCRGPPQPRPIRSPPPSDIPPSLLFASLPPFLLPALLTASLSPSLSPHPLRSRTQRGRAGRQAGGGLRGEKERWRWQQRWWWPAAGRQAQLGTRSRRRLLLLAGDQESVARPSPLRPSVAAPGTPHPPPPSSSTCSSPSTPLSFPSLHLICPFPSISGVASTLSPPPAPPLPSLARPPACFSCGG
jgi:hypothetical protein